jgi:hypothetical protein
MTLYHTSVLMPVEICSLNVHRCFASSYLLLLLFFCLLCLNMTMSWRVPKDNVTIEVKATSNESDSYPPSRRSTQDGATNRGPVDITSKWSIGWQTPTLMIACYLLGMYILSRLILPMLTCGFSSSLCDCPSHLIQSDTCSRSQRA